MIQTQSVKCPYCGYERNHTWDPTGRRDKEVVKCIHDALHEGCGRDFNLYWTLMVFTQTRKIEGEEQRAAE